MDGGATVRGVAKSQTRLSDFTSSILAWRIPGTEEPGGQRNPTPWGPKEPVTTEQLTLHYFEYKDLCCLPGATMGDPTHDKVMCKRTVKQGFRTQQAP